MFKSRDHLSGTVKPVRTCADDDPSPDQSQYLPKEHQSHTAVVTSTRKAATGEKANQGKQAQAIPSPSQSLSHPIPARPNNQLLIQPNAHVPESRPCVARRGSCPSAGYARTLGVPSVHLSVYEHPGIFTLFFVPSFLTKPFFSSGANYTFRCRRTPDFWTYPHPRPNNILHLYTHLFLARFHVGSAPAGLVATL